MAARLEVEPSGLRATVEALGSRGYVRPDRYGVPDLTATGRRALVSLARAGRHEVARLLRQPGGERERGRVMRHLTSAALREMPGHVGPAPGPPTAYLRLDLGWLRTHAEEAQKAPARAGEAAAHAMVGHAC